MEKTSGASGLTNDMLNKTGRTGIKGIIRGY